MKHRCQNVGTWKSYPGHFVDSKCNNIATRVSRMGLDPVRYCEKHYQYWIEFFKSSVWKKRYGKS